MASEPFLAAVRAAGLTGLATLPLTESRADDPMRWYEVFAEHPIGRGLDHPLCDPGKLARDRFKGLPPERRWGEEVAWLTATRDDVAIENPVVLDLIRLAPTKFFRVNGPQRFVREHLPMADFAYKGWGFNADKGPGAEGRPIRSICCNARGRKALIDAGVMKPSRFDAVATITAADAVAQDCAILDRTVPHSVPPPIYTADEAAAERARREAALAAAATSPASPRLAFASTGEAAAYLERRLANGTATWTPARDTGGFDAIRSSDLFASTPDSWQRLAPLLPLEVCDEGETDDDPGMDLELAEPQWNDWLGYDHDPDDPPDPDETPSADDLIIATTPFGDWYAFRKTDPALPADARITHWDHETTLPADQWPTVAAFAAAIIEAADRAAAGHA